MTTDAIDRGAVSRDPGAVPLWAANPKGAEGRVIAASQPGIQIGSDLLLSAEIVENFKRDL